MNGIELREQTSRRKAPTPILSRSSGEISNRMFAALVLSSAGYFFAILALFVMQSLGFNPWTIASGIAILIVPVSVLLIPVAGFLLFIATTRGQDTR